MNAQTLHEDLRRVAEANPTPTPELSPADKVRAEALLHRIISTERPSARTRRRRTTLIARLVAAVVAVMAAAVGASVISAPASAEAVLLQAATAAGAQTEADGRYWYVHTTGFDPATVPFHREIWLSRDGVGDVLRTGFWAAEEAKRSGAQAADPANVVTQALLNGGEPTPAVFGDSVQVTWEELDALPTNASELKVLLQEEMSRTSDADYDLWLAATALLSESPASPALRRALWEVIATIPDVSLLGPTVDSLGREGTAVQTDFASGGDSDETYVLDPEDGTVLERLILDDDGEVISGKTLIEQGFRDSAPQP